MGRISVASVVVAAVALLAVQVSLVAAQSADVCPDYTANGRCSTGSCASGGLVTSYSVPSTSFGCGSESCEYTGTIQLQGMKVTVAKQSSATSCCASCKASNSCKVWQWISTKKGGSCFIYPEVPKLKCGGQSTNVGGKCKDSKLSPPSPPPLGTDCPAYDNPDCNSPACTPTGVVGNYSVPATPFPCGFGSCEFTGTIVREGKKINLMPRASAADCAAMCSKRDACKTWQWIQTKTSGECFLYPEGLGPQCGAKYTTNVGIKCSLVCNDPHFVGAHGTHYDFNGQPGKSFCLVSDIRLHVNMKMTGYLDERTESASLIIDGKAMRTWIRELGLLWIDEEGSEHTLLLAAREGKETARGEGFLQRMEVDGTPSERMEVGEEAIMAGGLTVKFVSIQKRGIYDIDTYSVNIADLVDMTVQLRVAHPLLRRPDDAETHISLGVNWLKTTPAIHGVLGQTYREGREERTEEYSTLGAALKQAISADGESGKGFLDGQPSDYISSDVLRADCRYTGFNGRNMPTIVE